jgi:hypothetical protein
MSHHEMPNDSDEKFVPLSDNNSNLSWGRIIPMLFGVAALLVLALGIVKWVGYLQNEEQVEWRMKHQRPFRDSHQNWELINSMSEDKKEQMEGKATMMGEGEGQSETDREMSPGDDKKNDKNVEEKENDKDKEGMNDKEGVKEKEDSKDVKAKDSEKNKQPASTRDKEGKKKMKDNEKKH